MTKKNQLDFATRCVHAGQAPDPTTGRGHDADLRHLDLRAAVARRAQGLRIRAHARTRRAWRSSAASPISKAGSAGFAFASGIAAIATMLDLLDAGAHVIAVDDLYGGTLPPVRARAPALGGARFHLRRSHRRGGGRGGDPARTRGMIWVETPTNPLLKLVDLERVAALAKKRGI